MTNELANSLVTLRSRLRGHDESDAWFQIWQMTVGAVYSLARIAPFLPGHDLDHAVQSEEVARRLATGLPMEEGAFPTWSIGYYLNSAEFRIQSAFHRLLRAFTHRDGSVWVLARAITKRATELRLPPPVLAIITGFLGDCTSRNQPGGCLAIIHHRSNALKHDPVHDTSDRFSFRNRSEDAIIAVRDLILLTDQLGILCDEVVAA